MVSSRPGTHFRLWAFGCNCEQKSVAILSKSPGAVEICKPLESLAPLPQNIDHRIPRGPSKISKKQQKR